MASSRQAVNRRAAVGEQQTGSSVRVMDGATPEGLVAKRSGTSLAPVEVCSVKSSKSVKGARRKISRCPGAVPATPFDGWQDLLADVIAGPRRSSATRSDVARVLNSAGNSISRGAE